MIDFFVGISMIILVGAIVSAVHKYIDRRTKGSIPSDAEKRLNERINELDRRLTDIQDIVITNDDKLNRLESQSLVAPPSPPPIAYCRPSRIDERPHTIKRTSHVGKTHRHLTHHHWRLDHCHPHHVLYPLIGSLLESIFLLVKLAIAVVCIAIGWRLIKREN